MKYEDLKKVADYLEKNSDKGVVQLYACGVGSVFDAIVFEFFNLNGDKVTISIPADERNFSKITKTERF